MDAIKNIILSTLFDHDHARTIGANVVLNDNINANINLNSVSQLANGSPRRIEFATIIICTRGGMSVKLNLTDYNIQQGDVLVIAPGTIGQTLAVTPDTCLCLIAFSQKVYNESSKNSISQQLRDYILRDPMKVRLPEAMLAMAVAHYRLMRQLIEIEGFRYLVPAIQAHVAALSALLVQCIEEEDARRSALTRKELLLKRFLQEVRNHYDENRMVSFYADLLCVSPKHLSHVVKEVSGRQPIDWIRDYVLLNAKALLRDSNYSVMQVSELLSFPNPSFFGRYFKKYVGCTPRDYQKRQ